MVSPSIHSFWTLENFEMYPMFRQPPTGIRDKWIYMANGDFLFFSIILVFFLRILHDNSGVFWVIQPTYWEYKCEAPKIAKLAYNSNNYGLWYL